MSEQFKPTSESHAESHLGSVGRPAEHHLKFRQLGEYIIQSLPIGVIAFDTALRIIETNARAAELIDLSEDIDKSLAKGTDNQVWQNWSSQLKSAISSGKASFFHNVEYRSNNEVRLLNAVCTPLKDTKTQQTIGGTIIIDDVTEQVSVKKQLANAERLAAVGKLASRVAHELNNPMDGILRYVNLAIRTLEQQNLEKPLDYLRNCRRGLMRMVQIISELLEFSRDSYRVFEYAPIDRIVEDAVRTMESRIASSGVRVLRNYAGAIPPVLSGNLFQVFCNLIKNAVDAMPSGGDLALSTHLNDDNTVTIEFRDTGAGFPPENAEVIFEPFFTTKERSKGTGLGLAISKDIIEKYNGRITARNAPDKGSIFTVCLPLRTAGHRRPV